MSGAWTIPDETATRCDCGAGTYETDTWHWADDGWWCHDCWKEGAGCP